ncbi:MAG: hypothetical protein ACI4IK_00175 [Eubacterium sp.]
MNILLDTKLDKVLTKEILLNPLEKEPVIVLLLIIIGIVFVIITPGLKFAFQMIKNNLK